MTWAKDIQGVDLFAQGVSYGRRGAINFTNATVTINPQTGVASVSTGGASGDSTAWAFTWEAQTDNALMLPLVAADGAQIVVPIDQDGIWQLDIAIYAENADLTQWYVRRFGPIYRRSGGSITEITPHLTTPGPATQHQEENDRFSWTQKSSASSLDTDYETTGDGCRIIGGAAPHGVLTTYRVYANRLRIT